MKTNNSLKNRLLFICSIIVVISLILCLITIFLVRDLVMDDLEEHYDSILNLTDEQVVDHVQSPLEQLELSIGLLDETNFADYLDIYVKTNEIIKSIYIINSDAEIIHVSPYKKSNYEWNTAHDPAYNNAELEHWHWSQTYLSQTSGETVISASKIVGNYVVIAEIQLDQTPINISNEMLFGESVKIEVLDEWGTYIVSADKSKVEGRYRINNFEDIKEANSNNINKVDLLDTYKDEETTLIFKYNDTMSWYVLVKYDLNVVKKSILDWFIIISIIWSAFSMILVYFVIKYFSNSSHDIELLIDHTDRVSSGNYHLDDAKFNFVEFKSLGLQLQNMADIINNRTGEIVSINSGLEKFIHARTAELKKINRQLKDEITDREMVEDEIRLMNQFLDSKVKERTKELEVMNEELNMSVIEAYKANKAKGDFLAVMSHEMRTPLNGIIGFTHMLSMEIEDEDHSKTLELVLSSSKVLLTLINDVLDVSKYDAGQMQFEQITFNFGDQINDVLESFKVLSEAKGLEFNILSDDLSAILVKSDQTKIKQVFYNLLNNALKFTSEGSITVIINYTDEESDYLFNVQINDTGIGMSSVGDLMFEPFTQADDSIHRNFGGTGLGLSITKEILTGLSGNIEFKSDIDIGTTCLFTMRLSKSAFVERRYKDNKKILIVEDHIVNQTLMAKFFEKYNVDFDLACNGQEAVDLFKENNYDMILMDCQMPIMNGFDASKIIRSLDNNIQIIAMTAYTTLEDKKKCLDAGMNEFMSKPVDFKRLKELIGISESNELIIASDKTDILSPHVHTLMNKIGFDETTCRELIVTFIEQLVKALKEIDNLRETSGFAEISRILHQLKGASSTVRLTEINKIICEAEELIDKKDLVRGLNTIDLLKNNNLLVSKT